MVGPFHSQYEVQIEHLLNVQFTKTFTLTRTHESFLKLIFQNSYEVIIKQRYSGGPKTPKNP